MVKAGWGVGVALYMVKMGFCSVCGKKGSVSGKQETVYGKESLDVLSSVHDNRI